MDSVSERGRNTLNLMSFMNVQAAQVLPDIYNEQKNPKGFINLGIAENCTCEEVICTKVQECLTFNPATQYYYPFGGKLNFRNALADFLSERLAKGMELDPKKIVVTSGVGAAFDMMAHMFAEREDCFLVLAPFYSAIEYDVFLRSGVKLHHIHRPVHDTNKLRAFSFDEELLEQGYQEAIDLGHKVKAIIVINPGNPTGMIHTRLELLTASKFAQRHDIHIIYDEIYALSVFGDDAEFISALSMPELLTNDKSHFMWGFSKDFGISGIRCGMVYTNSAEYLKGANKLSYFGGVPSVIQDALARMISDKAWLDDVYFPTNLQRLRENHDVMEKGLTSLGIICHPVKAGFFIYANFSKYMKEQTTAEELKLFNEFKAAKVYLIPGTGLKSKEVGWFRVTFTNKQEAVARGDFTQIRILGSRLDRIEAVLKQRS
ncbi:hypothetical protein CAPTEDRAFT_201163 [Capitella teleta]|uniref:Aminotransferase class I/classII large domain-containing protein n=1 Tax=Capitella teleta TaxID=283909 RepID=R7VAA1_CAPTE|nr:hypothetical protein CAPTEDRAFT_201163 [Capitella teleta]|eukprot:ELU15743.1 hypothetical protein CAPTEDRAFT_201163 [Capitella teleta]